MPSIDAIDVCALTRIEYAALLLSLPNAQAYNLIHQRVQAYAEQARANVNQQEEGAEVLNLPAPEAAAGQQEALPERAA